jgi:FKBP-type peptidyl-prolyl cis-trans isomerase SlyD
MANPICIAKDTIVSFHYKLSDDKGNHLEESSPGEPLMYLHGHQQIIPGLEKALADQKVGAKLEVTVSPDQGYGPYQKEMVIPIPRDQFKNKKDLKAGAVFELSDGQGQVLLARVITIEKDTVVVDANHPMAGKTLCFAVEIMAIREATSEELKHGHAHSGGCCDGH